MTSLACQSSTSNQFGDIFVLLIILISIAITVWVLHAFLVCAFVWDTVSASLGLSVSCLRFFVFHPCSNWSGMLCPPPSWSSIWNAWLSACLRSLSPMLRSRWLLLGFVSRLLSKLHICGSARSMKDPIVHPVLSRHWGWCVQRNRCMTLSTSWGVLQHSFNGRAAGDSFLTRTRDTWEGKKEVSSHCVFRYRRVSLSKCRLI